MLRKELKMWVHTKAYKARKQKAEAKENKVLEVLEKMPKNKEGFVVTNFRVLANRAGIAYGAIASVVKRLERKGFVEVSESFKYVSSKHEKAIKVLK
jgi:DNA-binding MarR family transcriptional regulator